MDKKVQKIFFNNFADMDLLTQYTNDLANKVKETGDPKKIKIEIRKADEFDSSLSHEEIINRIDREISKTNKELALDLLRIWKHEQYYLIVGVKL